MKTWRARRNGDGRKSRGDVAKRSEREVMEAAFQARAGAIGIMASCICTYPIEPHETPTGHSEFCPSHLMITARAAAQDAAIAKARAFVDLFTGFDITDVAELSASDVLVIGLARRCRRSARRRRDRRGLMRCLPSCSSCSEAFAAECLLLERHVADGAT